MHPTLLGKYSGIVSRRPMALRAAPSKRSNLFTRWTRRSPPVTCAKRTEDRTSSALSEPVLASSQEASRETRSGDLQQQQTAPSEPRYRQAVPASPPQYPVPSPEAVVITNSGLPPWVWIMVGMLLATVFNKVMNFVSRPKEAMTEMMMKQMMNQMSSGKGSPFAPPASPFTSPAYDTTASPTTPPPPPPPPTPQASPVTSFMPSGVGVDTDPKKNGVQTPKVENIPPPPPSSSFFQDVSGGGQQTEATPVDNSDEAVDYMFDMLKNPQMRESLYQFLPEHMRSPEMLESVMASPMVKEQFKSMMTPELLQQIKGFQQQADSPEMRSQLEAMNVSPDVLMQKLMNEPEVVAMMQKPNVMKAVMDLQQHPENMSKYMNDPEVMQFMMKMNELTLQAQMQSQQPTPQTQPTQTDTTP